MSQDDVNKQFTKAKLKLMSIPSELFITTVFLKLKHVFTEDLDPPTAGTDGETIFFHPKYFMDQSIEVQVSILLHETWHVAFKHILPEERKGEREPKKWNIAADYVINTMLHKQGHTIPNNWYMDKKYSEYHTEKIYDLLPDEPEDKEGGLGNDLMPSKSSPKELKDKLDQTLLEASMIASQEDTASNMPSEIKLYIDSLRKPTLNWKRLLYKYFNQQNNKEFSYNRPKRRYFPKYYIPSTKPIIAGNITVVLDVSGSVSKNDLTQFVTDVFAIFKQNNIKEMDVIQFSVGIVKETKLEKLSDLTSLEFRGGGGTMIQPVFERIKDTNPDVIVVFTDGHIRDLPTVFPTKKPIIWLIKDNPTFKVNKGSVHHVR